MVTLGIELVPLVEIQKGLNAKDSGTYEEVILVNCREAGTISVYFEDEVEEVTLLKGETRSLQSRKITINSGIFDINIYKGNQDAKYVRNIQQ